MLMVMLSAPGDNFLFSVSRAKWTSSMLRGLFIAIDPMSGACIFLLLFGDARLVIGVCRGPLVLKFLKFFFPEINVSEQEIRKNMGG